MSNSINIKAEGKLADQIEEMKKRLHVESDADVVWLGLSLLNYAMGSKVEFKPKNSNRKIIFDKFKDLEPITDF